MVNTIPKAHIKVFGFNTSLISIKYPKSKKNNALTKKDTSMVSSVNFVTSLIKLSGLNFAIQLKPFNSLMLPIDKPKIKIKSSPGR